MSSLALTFIVLPFVLFGGFYFIALLNYELTPRIAALSKPQRMGVILWCSYSLIVGLDVVSTHYGIPGGIAAFCLTFFGVPLVGIGLALLGSLVYQGSASLSEVLADDTGIGTFLAWITLPIVGALFFGSGPGSAAVGALLGSALFFGLLATFGALYAVAKALDCISATGDAFKIPGWWDRALNRAFVVRYVARQRFWGLVKRCGLVRASEYDRLAHAEEIAFRNECAAEDALKEVRSTWFSPMAFGLQVKAHQRQAILAADLSATVRDLQAERLNSLAEIDSLNLENASLHEDLDAEGRRFGGALAGKDLQIERLRVERDTLIAQLEATDAGLFALYSGDLAPEVERSERISEALKDLDTVWGALRYAATPAEVHRFARAVQALEG